MDDERLSARNTIADAMQNQIVKRTNKEIGQQILAQKRVEVAQRIAKEEQQRSEEYERQQRERDVDARNAPLAEPVLGLPEPAGQSMSASERSSTSPTSAQQTQETLDRDRDIEIQRLIEQPGITKEQIKKEKN